MGKTSIEWTDASWNPIVGCTEISPGCANCYAARLSATRLKNHPDYKGLAGKGVIKSGPWWTGEVRFLPERLEEPLRWRKPRRIFVCDMGDLFHEAVHGDWIDQVLSVIAECPQHTFQILTKRAQRMHDLLRHYSGKYGSSPVGQNHVWLGVSVENQHFADERIPLLLSTPAAVRWISAEPLLGPVDLCTQPYVVGSPHLHPVRDLDWIVCGGESGPNARPMHPDWARSLRNQCQAAGVPFFFKQWGTFVYPEALGCVGDQPQKISKKCAGRLLDGREWSEWPRQGAHAASTSEFPR